MTLESLLKKSWAETKAYSRVFLCVIKIREWPEDLELRDELEDRWREQWIKIRGRQSWNGLKVLFYVLSGLSIIVTLWLVA